MPSPFPIVTLENRQADIWHAELELGFPVNRIAKWTFLAPSLAEANRIVEAKHDELMGVQTLAKPDMGLREHWFAAGEAREWPEPDKPRRGRPPKVA